ncbi:MAG: hypothetical protein UX79_C0009G0006 [candidate division WWE3 bacterium GW2011_GWB1_47_11]|uniref:Uncharacterized protein n=2 Tax=Katanobacteria TaxID=422282 RepID=A0A0G1RK81_UNCKA|nr:MAG: hypothetical protein UX73_C0025G0004 [candidate division WWE3 bacterium GW2011_GWC1_47_10]KKU57541.1 MAG: hypothetical protein UX79_C0009G0006 [candidate division WWE3 bacterium GW2011_GWB1_47_11]
MHITNTDILKKVVGAHVEYISKANQIRIGLIAELRKLRKLDDEGRIEELRSSVKK